MGGSREMIRRAAPVATRRRVSAPVAMRTAKKRGRRGGFRPAEPKSVKGEKGIEEKELKGVRVRPCYRMVVSRKGSW